MSLIGVHVSIAGGLCRAFERGENLGCEAIQIFLKNQRQWKAPSFSPALTDRFMDRWRRSSISKVVAHSSYLINLGAPEADQHRRSLGALEDELVRCEELGIEDLVLHPGSHKESGEEKGLERIVQGLQEILDVTSGMRVRLLLETMAGQGSLLGYRLEHFTTIFEGLQWHPRLGMCLDTCHLFGAGYDLRSYKAYDSFLHSLDRKIGLHRVWCWHCNDSKEPLGSRKDRHAHLGEGEIGLELFGHIVNDPYWEDIPCILETPKNYPGDEANLALLRKSRG